MARKKFPLPKRFNVALSEKAYAKLRALNTEFHYGNNYLLTVVLENFEAMTDAEAVKRVFSDFGAEYGTPAPGEQQDNR